MAASNFQWATGTVNTAGGNTIIPSPGAGYSLALKIVIAQNESSTATRILLQAGGNPANSIRRFCANQGDGIVLDLGMDDLWILPADTPLVMDLSGANLCSYSIRYRTQTS